MSKIDYQALREAAEKATALNLDTAQVKSWNDGYLECPCCDGAGYVEEESDFCNIDGVALGVQFYGIGEHYGLAESYLRAANPATVLALLDELEAAEKLIDTLRQDKDKVIDMSIERINNLLSRAESAEKRIAELSHHLQCAHDFIEHTEAFGYEATNGILCCGDAQWNIDSSKAALASAGSVNWEG